MSSSPTKRLSRPPEWDAPTPEQFGDEILPGRRPAILRAVARDWPLVVAARQDRRAPIAMLAAHASDVMADILRADPAEEGRFHYRPEGQSLNFVRGRGTLGGLVAALREQEAVVRPYSIVAQGLIAERFVPGFAKAHPMPLLPASVEPRLWVGNAAKVATHNDPTDNVAVVAAGRRRFTLFPPSAEASLYMGPKHPTPAGARISMVHVTTPDLDRFPLYAAALASAQEAELLPGDAIFIPRDWFHHVESIGPFNVLVNYWWDANAAPAVEGE